MEWYYSPWQYELREALQLQRARPAVQIARGFRIPDPVTGLVFAGAFALAYTPLLQPGPPAKTPTEGTLQIYQFGGGMVV